MQRNWYAAVTSVSLSPSFRITIKSKSAPDYVWLYSYRAYVNHSEAILRYANEYNPLFCCCCMYCMCWDPRVYLMLLLTHTEKNTYSRKRSTIINTTKTTTTTTTAIIHWWAFTGPQNTFWPKCYVSSSFQSLARKLWGKILYLFCNGLNSLSTQSLRIQVDSGNRVSFEYPQNIIDFVPNTIRHFTIRIHYIRTRQMRFSFTLQSFSLLVQHVSPSFLLRAWSSTEWLSYVHTHHSPLARHRRVSWPERNATSHIHTQSKH